jgi:hypothetical protein
VSRVQKRRTVRALMVRAAWLEGRPGGYYVPLSIRTGGRLGRIAWRFGLNYSACRKLARLP